MDNHDSYACLNLDKPVRALYHRDLHRISGSIFKSVCPSCPDGILPIRRSPETLRLEELDMCLLCGQRVKYLDIQILREKDPFN